MSYKNKYKAIKLAFEEVLADGDGVIDDVAEYVLLQHCEELSKQLKSSDVKIKDRVTYSYRLAKLRGNIKRHVDNSY